MVFEFEFLSWLHFLALMVAWPLAKVVLTVIYEVGKQMIPPTDLVARYCRKDAESWAVVTGATDGVGLGFV